MSPMEGRSLSLGWAIGLAVGAALVAYWVGIHQLFSSDARWDRNRSNLETSIGTELDTAFSTVDKHDRRVTFVSCGGDGSKWECDAFRFAGPENRKALARAKASGDAMADTSLFDHGIYDVRLHDGHWTATLSPGGGEGFIEKVQGELAS